MYIRKITHKTKKLFIYTLKNLIVSNETLIENFYESAHRYQ